MPYEEFIEPPAASSDDVLGGDFSPRPPRPPVAAPEVSASGFRPIAAPQGASESGFMPAAPPKAADPSLGDALWKGLKNFTVGFGRGAAGEGIPEGRASEFSGGRSGFGGRMLGAAGRGLAEGLWESIKAPGQYLTDERQMQQPSTELARSALGPAMLMAGGGGVARPIVTEAGPSAVAMALRNRAGGGPNPFMPAEGGTARPLTGPEPNYGPQITMPPLQAGGQAMPPMSAGPPGPVGGGGAPPMRPPPIIPPGQQPPPLRGQVPGEMRPAVPAPPGGSSIADAATRSPISDAIAGNNSVAVDRALTRTYRGAVKPPRPGSIEAPGASGLRGLAEQDRRIVTAIDQIIDNRPNLRLTTESGQEVAQQLPRSLRQFGEALDQTKRSIFEQYDAMAQQAGGAGVRVDLAPAAARLRAISETPQVVDLHPSVAADARRLADTMASRGSYSPGEAQDVIQNINRTIAGFYRNPTTETVSRASLLAPASDTLRASLDAAIEGAAGPGYQALRNRYGALRSVEKDVAAALHREANRAGGGLPEAMSDIMSGEQLIHGVLTFSPESIARGVAIRTAKTLWRTINDPNRAIGSLFQRRQLTRGPDPGPLLDLEWRGMRPLGAGAFAMPPQREPRHSTGAE